MRNDVMKNLVLMTLLGRPFICRYKCPHLYAWLSEPENLIATNQWPSDINMYLALNSAGSAYFSPTLNQSEA